MAATLLQPALFLHFALAFPEPKPWVRKRGWLVRMVYAPAALLLVVQAAAALAVTVLRDCQQRLERQILEAAEVVAQPVTAVPAS